MGAGFSNCSFVLIDPGHLTLSRWSGARHSLERRNLRTSQSSLLGSAQDGFAASPVLLVPIRGMFEAGDSYETRC